MRRFFLAICCLLSAASADPLTVCSALEDRIDLNGNVVRIRGIWSVGDSGQDLIPVIRCSRPIVQDGWVFQDMIDVVPEGDSLSVRQYVRQNLWLHDRHPETRNIHVVATLSGRLQSRVHFESFHDAFGVELLRAYGGYAAAQLKFSTAEHFEIHQFADEEEKQLLQKAADFVPKRVRR